MSDENIERMDFKALRREVRLLRDELAIMKRKYEDILYNLDYDNFSSRLIKEKDDMKAEITVTAEKIETKLSKTDLDGELQAYSTKTQTAEAITSTVTKEYMTAALGEEYVTNSVFQQTADGILSTVSAEYETKSNAEASYSGLSREITTVSQTASSIQSTVRKILSDGSSEESIFTQATDGFRLDGNNTTITGVIFLTDNAGNKKFSISHDESQGYEQVVIHSVGSASGLPIVIGVSDDLDFSNCSSVKFGKNAPVAVFG